MSGADMSAAAVSARLAELDRHSDLAADRRLDTKVDMSAAAISAAAISAAAISAAAISAAAISRRLREVGQALELCRRLGRWPQAPST